MRAMLISCNANSDSDVYLQAQVHVYVCAHFCAHIHVDFGLPVL